MLKARKSQGQKPPSQSGHPLPNESLSPSFSFSKANKRYIILTYVVEFDKVHYPLPLEYDVSLCANDS